MFDIHFDKRLLNYVSQIISYHWYVNYSETGHIEVARYFTDTIFMRFVI